jgi:hypothetical protein
MTKHTFFDISEFKESDFKVLKSYFGWYITATEPGVGAQAARNPLRYRRCVYMCSKDGTIQDTCGDYNFHTRKRDAQELLHCIFNKKEHITDKDVEVII